jgi:hypothetical protein
MEIDPDHIEDEFFIPLGHVVAAAAAPEFGQPRGTCSAPGFSV